MNDGVTGVGKTPEIVKRGDFYRGRRRGERFAMVLH
jgi:hypothetical protein